MKKQRVLHLQALIEHGACDSQVAKFKELFGDKVIVTEARARKYADVFNWQWAASYLLSPSARKAYEARAPAYKAYLEAKASAWKAYQEAEAPAWKAYQEAETSAWKAYKEANLEAMASAFANAFIND